MNKRALIGSFFILLIMVSLPLINNIRAKEIKSNECLICEENNEEISEIEGKIPNIINQLKNSKVIELLTNWYPGKCVICIVLLIMCVIFIIPTLIAEMLFHSGFEILAGLVGFPFAVILNLTFFLGCIPMPYYP